MPATRVLVYEIGMQSKFKREQPWQPRTWSCAKPRKTTTKDRAGNKVAAWDLRGYADNQQWFKRMVGPRHLAQREANTMHRDWLNGFWWDPKAKVFIPPPRPIEATSVVELALRYWEANCATWAPATRARNAFALRLMCTGLTVSHNTIDDSEVAKLFKPNPPLTYQEVASKMPAVEAASLRSVEVTTADFQRFVQNYRATTKPKPATERRVMATIRACWNFGLTIGAVKPPSPADSVTTPTVSRQAGTVTSLANRPTSVDSRKVISPQQAILLSELVAPRFKAFVLVMAFCGLRPSEATALRTTDIDLEARWLTVGNTTVLVSDEWLTDDDPTEDAPLKGRATGETRRVPIPEAIVSQIKEHVDKFATTDLMFTTANGKRIALGNFDRDEWRSAVAQLGDEWQQLRRHDLRHTACSTWLNAGISPAVAVQWSGHRSLAVFLDIYQGVWGGQEQEAIDRLNQSLGSTKAPTEAGAVEL